MNGAETSISRAFCAQANHNIATTCWLLKAVQLCSWLQLARSDAAVRNARAFPVRFHPGVL